MLLLPSTLSSLAGYSFSLIEAKQNNGLKQSFEVIIRLQIKTFPFTTIYLVVWE